MKTIKLRGFVTTRLGNTCLLAYLHKIYLVSSPNCTRLIDTHSVTDADHIILECFYYSHFRGTFYQALIDGVKYLNLHLNLCEYFFFSVHLQ